jgi:hypothetical protein
MIKLSPTVLIAGAGILVATLTIGGAYHLGYKAGAASVQSKWDKAKAKDAAAVAKEKARIASVESTHRGETRKVENELVQAQATHAHTVTRVRNAAVVQLRKAEERSALYRAAAETGTTARLNLASHATQLDRALVEGIELVGELKSTIELREAQLRALGEQIRADREVLGGTEGL